MSNIVIARTHSTQHMGINNCTKRCVRAVCIEKILVILEDLWCLYILFYGDR